MIGYWKGQAVPFLIKNQQPSVSFQSTYFVPMFFFISTLFSILNNIWAEFWKLLTCSWRRSLSYRNQFIDFPSKSMDWFLYDRDLRHEKGMIRIAMVWSGLIYLEVDKLSNFQKHSDTTIVWLISSFVYFNIKSSTEKMWLLEN